MIIPQINETQLAIIADCVNGTGALSQIQPDKDKDTPEDFANWSRALQHVDGLVEIGLLEDISDKCKDQIANVMLRTGRAFRIFEASKIARGMFLIKLDEEGKLPAGAKTIH